MADSAEVDLVVVGLGPGGEHAAAELAGAGLEVVGVDRRLVGGECPYYGCIPSKMMLRAAGLLAEARRVPGTAGSVEVIPSWSQVARRIRDEATDDWDDAVAVERLQKAGARFVRGTGRLAGPGRVVVATDEGEQEIRVRRGVVLNTGTEPAIPPIDGLAGTPYWTNREAVRVTRLPRSLVVLGGGAIGCELAQAFARFGVRVTIVEAGERILGPEEPESSEVLAAALARDGIEVRTGVAARSVRHDGGFHLALDGGESISADELLVAVGRTSNLRDIGLETVGLDPGVRFLDPDERMRVGEGVWAIGDITGKGAFTHMSMYQADVAVRDLLGREGAPADYRAVGRVTFTDPEIGSVGMTERQARDAGLRVQVGTTDLATSSRGWLHVPGGAGVVKLVADADRGILVGGTTAGPSGGEMLGWLATAVHAEVPVATLRSMHFAYPTFHRAIEPALDALA
ncbi:MAG: NAD(P)/FAD-dependent oxidoreductase [Nocardioidaceae bacterium]|nr:NAD(P)/FAD-dependent oxidoreductase [Nocardioidaceae bacterium]MCL2612259.1 NAD(P)/FAD-dependent oxidoreductase [Nocardioidaceae bacterium]